MDDYGFPDWLQERLWADAVAVAERSLETDELSRLIWENEEFALLDNLLDALRYGADATQAWADLRTGLLQSVAQHTYNQLAESESKRAGIERQADAYEAAIESARWL